MTPSLTPFMKKSMPTLVLLTIIVLLSGCVGAAIDRALKRATENATNLVTDLAKNAFPDIDEDDINSIEGIDDLDEDDPCLDANALFSNDLCLEIGTDNENTYNGLREAQCFASPNPSLCATTITRACGADLDHELCTGAVYDRQRMERDDRLEQNRLTVNIADWTGGFTDDDGAVVTLNSEPVSTDTENGFLSDLTLADLKQYTITADHKATFVGGNPNDPIENQRRIREQRVFTITSADTGGRGHNRSIGTLTLAHRQTARGSTEPVFYGFKGLDADGGETDTGDVMDGVSFVAGQYNQRFGECQSTDCDINRYYAGVHATTDLGAPITDVAQVSQWRGFFRIVGAGNLTSVPFDINITFNTETNGGTIKANFTNAGTYDIDATYNNFGTITGDVTLLNSPGKVSGIIGQEGLVAAFISDFTGATSRLVANPSGYAGGFVAYLPNPEPDRTQDPCIARNQCVDYAHWADAAAGNPTTTPTANRFLTGTATGLTTGDSSNTGLVTTLASSNLAIGLRAEDAADGFAIFFDGDDHNAGLLSTTRIGAPWENTGVNLTWEGTFVARAAGADLVSSTPFTLIVNYSRSNSSGSIRGTSNDDTPGQYSFTVGGSNEYSFMADFNSVGLIENGVITRTVGTDISTGVVTGLVGTGIGGFGAAVGVFHSNAGADTSYVGGFVASANSPNTQKRKTKRKNQ